MFLKRIHVKNFRSIRDVTVELAQQVAIVGGNGTGKSTILRAIDRFFGQSTTVEMDDFFARAVDNPIEIALTFTAFNDSERELFASRIHDDEMTVVRIFDKGAGRNNGRYFGAVLQHIPFEEIRSAPSAVPARAAYQRLRESNDPKYATLPTIRRADEIPPILAEWEKSHPNECELAYDDGQFFGFTNVARGSLQKAINFVFIPAVRDAAADAVDARGAVVARLLELVVRSAIQRRRDIQEFQGRISSEYRSLTDPAKLQELGAMSGELTDTLQVFYKEAAVVLRWKAVEDFSIPLPTADIFLDDDGFEGPVDHKGHGLQRALILTLLQHLSNASSAEVVRDETRREGNSSRSTNGDEGSTQYRMPGLILAIEEPELYQHPTKQRHFAKILGQLSRGELDGVAGHTQILFATHSSLFISMDRFDEVRLTRRERLGGNEHKECRLTASNLASVARSLEEAYGKPNGTFTAEGLKARLHIVGAELAEGFFAEAVVLVEGVTDRAAILAAASTMKIDLEALGIAVLTADGKTKLDRPLAIFLALGIPTYAVWDCDRTANGVDGVEQNRALQRLVSVPAAELSDARTRVEPTFACFETELEIVLKEEIGSALYEEQLNAAKTKYGIEKHDDAKKAPIAMQEVLAQAAAKGRESTTLKSIVNAIVELRNRAGSEKIDVNAAMPMASAEKGEGDTEKQT